MVGRPRGSTLFPYPAPFRARGSHGGAGGQGLGGHVRRECQGQAADRGGVGDQLDGPGAGYRRGEVAVAVGWEGPTPVPPPPSSPVSPHLLPPPHTPLAATHP